MIVPLILALTFLIGSTTIPRDPEYTYDVTTKEIYDTNKRSTSRDIEPPASHR
jgi:hypothetical protein